MNSTELMDAAREVRANAYAPYSGYMVGAALLASDGRVFTGCNVESSSYGLTVCAERVALGKAISEGARTFDAIAVTAGSGRECLPCGGCRQSLWEFAPGLVVIVEDEAGGLRKEPLADLLPQPFDKRHLEGG